MWDVLAAVARALSAARQALRPEAPSRGAAQTGPRRAPGGRAWPRLRCVFAGTVRWHAAVGSNRRREAPSGLARVVRVVRRRVRAPEGPACVGSAARRRESRLHRTYAPPSDDRAGDSPHYCARCECSKGYRSDRARSPGERRRPESRVSRGPSFGMLAGSSRPRGAKPAKEAMSVARGRRVVRPVSRSRTFDTPVRRSLGGRTRETTIQHPGTARGFFMSGGMRCPRP